MGQIWLQVGGMIVEFAGVMLLAWEWFAARRQDLAERALAETQARREESMAGLQRVQADNTQMQRHLEMSRDMQRRMTASQVHQTRAQYGSMRGWAVGLALALIVTGFVLQLMGTWPGCCRLIDVVPAG